MSTPEARPRLIDRFGREVNYVRLSITDRCDFRCVYCMAEQMTFLPREQVLTLEELYQLSEAFVSLGVRKIRLTGGEPLIRRNVMSLIERLGALEGLDELVLTTNGSQLPKMAEGLRAAGVRRINISLDSLKPDRFRQLTRIGKLEQVLAGIDAAQAAGFERIKLNAVILRGRNDDEILDLAGFAIQRGLDLTFIEEMPLGQIEEHDRAEAFMPSEAIREVLQTRYALMPSTETTGGPSRYWHVEGEPTRIGFISPHSHNFCHLCNRVRVTVEGRLLLCLGNEHSMDLRSVLREHPGDQAALQSAIRAAMDIKPERHEFSLDAEPQIVRFMNMTGG
ncbi:MAG: GTP 3',8-cyclase MoaA [Gammaproteobacteria bacterium]|nr:MAG: GTP 3',8-cyclase MoaA [Gammaproteobacteria bacterium]